MSNWDARFIALAKVVASWSKDPRTQVGCVIVRPDKTVASLGFNGLPRRIVDSPHLLEDRAMKHRLVIHAEENALLHAREPVAGYTIYTWPVPPCSRCASKLIQVGIARVVAPAVPQVDPDSQMEYELSEKLLRTAGIERVVAA